MRRRPALVFLVALVGVSACTSSPPEIPVATSLQAEEVEAIQEVIEGAVEMATDTTIAEETGPTVLPVPLTGEIEAVVMERLSHDSSAFTQGLVIRDGLFYESTGQYGESTVRIINSITGEILAEQPLGEGFFGEGLEVVHDRIIQLTWREETAFVWDATTLELLDTYSYDGEGWGLCATDEFFVMSNGTSQLTLRDLVTFEPFETVDVTSLGESIELLNELECTPGGVFANVWKTSNIVIIDVATGEVLADVDASSLFDSLSSTDGIDVLNGIAYDQPSDTYYLTGKYWPEVFEVEFR